MSHQETPQPTTLTRSHVMSDESPQPKTTENAQTSGVSARDLIKRALDAETDEEAWECVEELHRRGTADVLARARRLCLSSKPEERMLGADILGQLGVPRRTFPHECAAILVDMLKPDELPAVLQSVGVALGHLKDTRALEPLAKLRHHPDPRVRDGVVAGLLGRTENAAVDALVDLSGDIEKTVRDWATFGIGLEIDTDSEAIREALYHRLCDPEEKIRHQAMLGLARRKDKIARKIIYKELRRSEIIPIVLEAAEELGDPKLYPSLENVAERDIQDPLLQSLLQRALDACAGD